MEQFPEQSFPAEPHQPEHSSAAQNNPEMPFDPGGPRSLEQYNDIAYLDAWRDRLAEEANDLLLGHTFRTDGLAHILQEAKTLIDTACYDDFEDEPVVAERLAYGLRLLFATGAAAVEHVFEVDATDNADDVAALFNHYQIWRGMKAQDECLNEMTAYLESEGAHVAAWHVLETGIASALANTTVSVNYGEDDIFILPASDERAGYWQREGVIAALFAMRCHRTAKAYEAYLATHTTRMPPDWFAQPAE